MTFPATLEEMSPKRAGGVSRRKIAFPPGRPGRGHPLPGLAPPLPHGRGQSGEKTEPLPQAGSWGWCCLWVSPGSAARARRGSLRPHP